MKLASVIGVTLDDKSNDTVGSIIAIEKGSASGQLRCFPLNTNNRHIPIIGESVYIVSGNSDDASGNNASTRYYYTSIVSLQKNINHNALPNLTKVVSGGGGGGLSSVSNGIPAQSSTDSKVDFGPGFQESQDVSQLQPFLGDIIHEGRFGQSIRFGYTPSNTSGNNDSVSAVSVKPSWTSTTTDSPITIIRNGAGTSNGYNKFVIEDINKDDSSIWLGSKQKIGLKSSNNFTLGVIPTGTYKNPQIILNSDRVVINSKSDSVLISGDKSVNVSTTNWKADMDVIFSQLESITDALLKLAPAITGATAGPVPIASLTAAGPQLLSTITQVKTQLQLMKQ
jgi:hypothetical protein